MMDGAGEEFLAGATFAEKKNGGIGLRDALNLEAEITDRTVFADDTRKTITCGKFLAEQKVFAKQLLLACGPLHEDF